MKKQGLTKMLVLLLLTLASYIPTFIWMVNRWGESDSYYSHGYLVPFITLFIIWMKKDKFSALAFKPSAIGWPFFLGGMLVHLVSALWQVYFPSGFSFPVVLAGLVLIFLGKNFLKQLMFPILFLFFMIPLPLVAIAQLSFQLKIIAARIATAAVNGMGVPAIRDGSVIRTMHSQLVVEDPCSGIRSLVALLALGALMAYFSRFSKTKKIVLFALSVPIAISSNVIRIIALTLASEMYGSKFATGVFHDTMGILVFVFAFLGLLFFEKTMES